MDKITHEVRRTQWMSIITECQSRTDGSTVKQWLADNGIKEKAYYYWLRRFRVEAYEQMHPDDNGSDACPTAITFAEVKLPQQPINDTQIHTGDISQHPFTPDAIIKSGEISVAISNSISGLLLSQIMEGLHNAR